MNTEDDGGDGHGDTRDDHERLERSARSDDLSGPEEDEHHRQGDSLHSQSGALAPLLQGRSQEGGDKQPGCYDCCDSVRDDHHPSEVVAHDYLSVDGVTE